MTPFTPLPSATSRTLGALVYIHGVAPAMILQPDDEGAIIRECDDLSEGWHPWDRLTDAPAPPLRFTITKNDTGLGAPWDVVGNRPDDYDEGDYLWGHFPTHHDAIQFASYALTEENTRLSPTVSTLTDAVAAALDDRGAHDAARLVRETDPDDDLWNNYLGPMLDELERDYGQCEAHGQHLDRADHDGEACPAG
ncbi:MAG: hypothetical protein ACTIKT_09755 [Microbacterium sp.]